GIRELASVRTADHPRREVPGFVGGRACAGPDAWKYAPATGTRSRAYGFEPKARGRALGGAHDPLITRLPHFYSASRRAISWLHARSHDIASRIQLWERRSLCRTDVVVSWYESRVWVRACDHLQRIALSV